MLEMRQVGKMYRHGHRSIRALDGVSLSVAPGEFVAVRGPSGCGKTTLLLTAGGLLRPDSGQVQLDDCDAYAQSPDERARLRASAVGYVFQQFHLVAYLSVLENVLAPNLARRSPGASQRAKELAERFGLADRLDHVPADLSTGERQRTALARAMLNRPKLLLADEPTGNLDEGNGREVLASIAEFAVAGGAVLLVTHDVAATQYAGRILEMKDGALDHEREG